MYCNAESVKQRVGEKDMQKRKAQEKWKHLYGRQQKN